MNKKLVLASMVAAVIGFALFFEGQAAPIFDLSRVGGVL